MKQKPLFIKLLMTIPLITIVTWFASAYLASAFLYKNLWKEFVKYNERVLVSISRESVNDIQFGDYFQLRKTLHDFYDKDYMSYLAFYTKDMTPLSIFPTQLPGEDMQEMENSLSTLKEEQNGQKFFKRDGKNLFHMQLRVLNESNELLGYLIMGGTTAGLEKTIWTQMFSFIAIGAFLLLIQIGAIIYFVNKFTKPLRTLTKTIREAETKRPDKIISSLVRQSPPATASSEVHTFFETYKSLLLEIQKHQDNIKQMAVRAAIGKVASHIAHDMRSPLSVVKGALVTDLNLDPDKKLLFTTAYGSALKLDQMADDLLDYSKARLVEKRPSNIMKVIHEVIREVKEFAKHEGKTIIYTVDAPENLFANVDPHRMNRVITNIITNSVQAIKHKEGKIDVQVEVKNDKDVLIKIADNGEGITPEHMKDIFDSAFTFGKRTGTGLGLAYCKNVIDAHEGDITAESVPGEGAAFTILLPDSVTETIAPAEETPAPEILKNAPIQTDKKILVMDDEDGLLIMWRVMIKEATGRTPMEINRPEKLLEMRMEPGSIDVAIIDYEFRGSDLNGLDVIEYLRQKGIKECYLCTAYYQDAEIKAKADKLGIKMIIPKPIPENILSQILC